MRSYPAALDDAVRDLVLNNREELIKRVEPNEEVQRHLIEINQRIEAIRASDPSVVAAWGLACGAGCKVQSGGGIAARAPIQNPVIES
ncbi:hypothetical protein ACWEVP_02965 [Amycolatopsis sp. NPDC003865]